jgi:hypothetical protein
MARIRTIQPNFAQSVSMRRVSRDARLTFVYLVTHVDDEGRGEADFLMLTDRLYPSDPDAPAFITSWLDELEREGCIERYRVEDGEYLRIVNWHEHQQIDHPTESRLPPSPNERPEASRIREASRRIGANRRKVLDDQELVARSEMLREKQTAMAGVAAYLKVTQQSLLREVEDIQLDAKADGRHSDRLRGVALKWRIAAPAPEVNPAAPGEPSSVAPHEAHGLPATGEHD